MPSITAKHAIPHVHQTYSGKSRGILSCWLDEAFADDLVNRCTTLTARTLQVHIPPLFFCQGDLDTPIRRGVLAEYHRAVVPDDDRQCVFW